MKKLTAKDVMNANVVSVNMNTSVEDLVKLFSETELTGAPVVDDENKVVGIVTERDLTVGEQRVHFPTFMHILDGVVFLDGMKHFEEDLRHALASRVKDLMKSDVIFVEENAPLEEVTNLVTKKDINRIPVVRDGVLVGIITRADLVRALSK